jgi:aminopeptidase N
MPADFFRTMEDASGIDLDWFFRGWFYTTDHTDLAIENVRQLNVDTRDPDVENPRKERARESEPETLSQQRNKQLPKRVAEFEELKDFYNAFDELDVTDQDRQAYRELLKGLNDEEKQLLETKQNFYIIDFLNQGGLVMPIILQIEFTDDSRQQLRIPAEIWRRNSRKISKLVITDKMIKSLTLDPHLETADVDLENNYFPRRIVKSRFQLFKEKKQKNEMQKAKGKEAE